MKITPDRFEHETPEAGACVMEMVALLSQDWFSDDPTCTNTFISGVARIVNDRLPREDRHLIMSQFDRLFDTVDSETNEEFRSRFKEFALSLKPDPKHQHIVRGLTDYQDYAKNHTDGRFLMHDAVRWIDLWLRQPIMPEEKVRVLSDILDIHDEVVGRTEVPKQDLSKLVKLLGR